MDDKNILKQNNLEVTDFDSKNIFFDFIHLLNTYKNYVNPNSIVVEIGASNKHRTQLFSRYCKQLVGIEYFLERLRTDFDNAIYKQGDWQNLAGILDDDNFDILVSSHCIEHVFDDLAAVNETYRILKPGGVAIFNTPNRKRLVRRIIELFTGERKFPWREHVREYTKKDLVKLLERSKFKNYKIEPICLGIKGLRWLCIKKCPKYFEDLCIYWEIILYK